MKHCPGCGAEVRESDKFCANCGFRLTASENQNLTHEIKIQKFKICDLCGEENSIDADECSYCGVGFTGKEKIVDRENESIKIESKEFSNRLEASLKDHTKKKVKESKTKSKPKIVQESNLTGKRLSSTQILILFFVLIIIAGILILYGLESGDSVKGESPVVNEQSKIDLSKLNEINQLEEEIKNDPENATKLLRIANLTHDAGFFEKAISYYTEYLKLNPEDNDAEVDMGVCYFELNQLDRAEEIFKSVIKKNPSHQIAYLNLGIVQLTKGNLEESKESFKKCISLGEHTDAGHRAKELLESH